MAFTTYSMALVKKGKPHGAWYDIQAETLSGAVRDFICEWLDLDDGADFKVLVKGHGVFVGDVIVMKTAPCAEDEEACEHCGGDPVQGWSCNDCYPAFERA